MDIFNCNNNCENLRGRDFVVPLRRNSASYVTRLGSTVETEKHNDMCVVLSKGTQTYLDRDIKNGIIQLEQTLQKLMKRRMF